MKRTHTLPTEQTLPVVMSHIPNRIPHDLAPEKESTDELFRFEAHPNLNHAEVVEARLLTIDVLSEID